MAIGTQERRTARRERGVALVEFAIVAPVLFALLIGTFTGGLALAQKNSVTNAAREGARLGATVPTSSTWATDVRDRVIQNSSGDLTAAQICVALVNSSNTVISGMSALGSECSALTAPSVPAGASSSTPTQCVVKVWVHRTAQVDAIFFSRQVSLDAAAVARFERGGGATCA